MAEAEEMVPILVVDDQANNLLAMESLLASMGLPLQVVTAESGNLALRLSLQQPFALILLDVQMPGMTGYEVAELLRANPKTQAIPIIFVTAGMTTQTHVIEGYESGAVDYLAKPIDRRLLTSKVRVFTELFQQRRRIERSEQYLEQEVRRRNAELHSLNAELEQRVELRSQQLNQALARAVESERQAALGRVVAGVAHEMNTPLGNILMASSALSAEMDRLALTLDSERVSRQKLVALGGQCRAEALLIEGNANRMAALVRHFKELGDCPENEAPSRFELLSTIEGLERSMASQLSAAGVRIEKDIEPDLISIGFPLALERIVSLLIGNSLTHAFAEQDKPVISIQARVQAGQLLLRYSDNGCGAPSENLSRLFDPFFSTRMGQGGSGLGLSTARKLMTEQLKGQIRASCPAGEGLRLELSWPLNLIEVREG